MSENSIVCPGCKHTLEETAPAVWRCTSCARVFPVNGGVLELAKAENAMGENAAQTVQQFGDSWQIHDHMEGYYERQFLDWISPLTAADFKGKVILEAGCGKGRHSKTVADFDPERLFSVDLSSAIYLAAANTKGRPAVQCLRADLLDLPLAEASVDLAFCVGVLHHLANPEAGLRQLWKTLKPGGTLCLWVYAREGNGWVVALVDPLRKGITSRIPTKLLRPLAWPLSAFLFLLLMGVYGPATGGGTRAAGWLPYASYLGYISKFPFREIEHIVLDHLCPPIAHYLRKEALEGWFSNLSAKSVTLRWHNRNSWTAVATKE